MSYRLPRPLLSKRTDLAIERAELLARLDQVEDELRALDLAIQTLDPDWEPPSRVARRCKGSRLPRGAVAQTCLQLLRGQASLWTGELASQIAARYKVTFESRRAELDFASAVAMAMRRHQRRGAVQEVECNPRTAERRWRLSVDESGRFTLVRPAMPGHESSEASSAPDSRSAAA